MRGREGSPYCLGPRFPPLSPPGNSGPFLKVVVVTSYRVKTPSFQPHSPVLSCQKQRKLPTPKMLNHKVRLRRKVGVGWGG